MKNKIKILNISLLFILTSCNANFYDGELITKNTSEIISYINEYRINSNFEYLIPIESSSSLSKKDIKEIKLDDKMIDEYELEKISETNFKYNIKIKSNNSYKKLNILLSNNKEYIYYLNLINFNDDLFNDEYTFKVIDFNVSEDVICNYKITYMLNFKNDISLFLDNSLKIDHPMFKGSAKLINMETGLGSYNSLTKASLDKNTNYLLMISFDEDSSCYYFDEFVPFKIETKVNNNLKNYYIIPKYENILSSNILEKIF